MLQYHDNRDEIYIKNSTVGKYVNDISPKWSYTALGYTSECLNYLVLGPCHEKKNECVAIALLL